MIEGIYEPDRFVITSGQLDFTITFEFIDSDSIRASVIDSATEAITELEAGVDFTVSSTVLTTAAQQPVGDTLLVYLEVPYIQQSQYDNPFSLDLALIEQDLDRACLERQSLSERLSRCIRSSVAQGPVDVTADSINEYIDSQVDDIIADAVETHTWEGVATSGQTIITISGFTLAPELDDVSVFIDGSKLRKSDLTRLSSLTLQSSVSLTAGDEIEVKSAIPNPDAASQAAASAVAAAASADEAANYISALGTTVTDLATDVAQAGSAEASLLLVDAQTLTADLVIPSNVHLIVQQQGRIAGAYTLTIQGAVSAPQIQIFDDDLTVDFDISPIREIQAAWFGVIVDGVATYASGWTFTAGTDQSTALNKAIACADSRDIMLPASGTRAGIYITNPIKFVSGTSLVGCGWYGCKFICNQGAQNAMEVDDTIYEVSFMALRGVRLHDARNDLGSSETSGYGVFANEAVNGVIIKQCFIDGFSDGAVFVGADTNSRAGDCITLDELWVGIGSVSNFAIGYGNFNNTLSINNIRCSGDGNVIKRTNGNNVSCSVHIQNVKHEAGSSAYDTIITSNADICTISNIVRIADTGNTAVTINPVSLKGFYSSILHTKSDLTGNNAANMEYSTGDQFFFRNAISELAIIGRTTSSGMSGVYSGPNTPNGNVIADLGSIYLRTDGTTTVGIYVKEADAGLATGWVSKM